ncbi:MAG TPA: hypothetical protein VJA21_28405 [Verrucomicrobiae bacterium]
MLTQLATVKARLGLLDTDVQYDSLLTRAVEAVSARFDRECNRTLARTVGAVEEFGPAETEIVARCYPVETVSKFELRTTEAEGWVERTGVGYVLRQGCVISLAMPLSFVPQVSWTGPQLGRVTYTGGYVMPDATPGAGQTALPADLESAAVEQVAAWFQNRDKLGLIRHWPSGGTYLVFSQLPLLPQVSAIIRPYRRWVV